MTTIHQALACKDPARRDQADLAAYCIMGITGPGACALREADGRLMIWATEGESVNDDGGNATYRSAVPISDAEWSRVKEMAWIESSESA